MGLLFNFYNNRRKTMTADYHVELSVDFYGRNVFDTVIDCFFDGIAESDLEANIRRSFEECCLGKGIAFDDAKFTSKVISSIPTPQHSEEERRAADSLSDFRN